MHCHCRILTSANRVYITSTVEYLKYRKRRLVYFYLFSLSLHTKTWELEKLWQKTESTKRNEKTNHSFDTVEAIGRKTTSGLDITCPTCEQKIENRNVHFVPGCNIVNVPREIIKRIWYCD